MLLISVLVFIYSLETENSYNVNQTKFNILKNINYETCMVGKLSNGTNIENRFNQFSINIYNYCSNLNILCNLTIIKKSSAPTNLSLLNYTHFNYSIDYSNNNYKFKGDLIC